MSGTINLLIFTALVKESTSPTRLAKSVPHVHISRAKSHLCFEPVLEEQPLILSQGQENELILNISQFWKVEDASCYWWKEARGDRQLDLKACTDVALWFHPHVSLLRPLSAWTKLLVRLPPTLSAPPPLRRPQRDGLDRRSANTVAQDQWAQSVNTR